MHLLRMIKSIKHRALARYFQTGATRGLKQDQIKRIRNILTIIHAAKSVETMDTSPGMRLHPLHSDMDGFWSRSVSGNWRIIFRFEDGDAFDLDLIDYH